ncbi:MAG: VOC family protein [Solirubrobacteraceae bacterium]
MLLGLRTVIYPAADLERSKSWYAAILGVEPYFDESFYVGFDVGGYELGLDPNPEVAAAGPRTYWGVEDAVAALQELLGRGARPHGEVTEVGDGIKVASVLDPSGHILGIIENPHFTHR